MHFDLHRMPELFCGFPRQPGEAPIRHPVACAPQAWSAAAVLLLLQACLGLEINGARRRNPLHPAAAAAGCGELQIRNLEVAGATVDLLLVRQGQAVAVRELRRGNAVRVVAL